MTDVMEELRRVVAEIIGANTESWPEHGNAPLAIAATVGILQARAKDEYRERDEKDDQIAALKEQLDNQRQHFGVVIRDCERKFSDKQKELNEKVLHIDTLVSENRRQIELINRQQSRLDKLDKWHSTQPNAEDVKP